MKINDNRYRRKLTLEELEQASERSLAQLQKLADDAVAHWQQKGEPIPPHVQSLLDYLARRAKGAGA